MPTQKREKLTEAQIQDELTVLKGWDLASGKLHRRFKFENFIDAFAFMTKLALVSERINHHPEWTNVYNTVEIFLTTHDVGAVSNLDVEFARSADHYFGVRR